MRRLLVLVLAACPVPGGVRAQTSGELNAFTALSASPIGSLSPLMTPAMISRPLNGAQLAIRYGLRDAGDWGSRTHAIAATGVFAVGLAGSFTLTAGVVDAECRGCSPSLMLGLGGDMRIVESPDVLGDGTSLSVALSGDIGYGEANSGDLTAVALGVGAPVTLSFGTRSDGMRIVPYVAPVFGVGSTSAACTPVIDQCQESGTRWVLGAGIGFWNPLTNVSASIGVNQVMLSGASPVFGVNVQLGGR